MLCYHAKQDKKIKMKKVKLISKLLPEIMLIACGASLMVRFTTNTLIYKELIFQEISDYLRVGIADKYSTSLLADKYFKFVICVHMHICVYS